MPNLCHLFIGEDCDETCRLTEDCAEECEKCAIHSCGPCHQLVKSDTACCKCVPIPYCGTNSTVAPTSKLRSIYVVVITVDSRFKGFQGINYIYLL